MAACARSGGRFAMSTRSAAPSALQPSRIDGTRLSRTMPGRTRAQRNGMWPAEMVLTVFRNCIICDSSKAIVQTMRSIRSRSRILKASAVVRAGNRSARSPSIVLRTAQADGCAATKTRRFPFIRPPERSLYVFQGSRWPKVNRGSMPDGDSNPGYRRESVVTADLGMPLPATEPNRRRLP
jgi:hypothetical protein